MIPHEAFSTDRTLPCSCEAARCEQHRFPEGCSRGMIGRNSNLTIKFVQAQCTSHPASGQLTPWPAAAPIPTVKTLQTQVGRLARQASR